MDKKRKNLLEMRKLGFSQKTLSLMTESQVAMILEKIKKKETKEGATVKQTTEKTFAPGSKVPKPDLEGGEVESTDKGTKVTKSTETTESRKKETKEGATVKQTTEKTFAPGSKVPKSDLDGGDVESTDKGTKVTKSTETTEGKKTKKKKYNPWAVCTASVGRKNKKKYEDCVMGVKKKLKEGRNPYEYLIESKMEEIVENNLSPKMTKGELLRIIAEKKMMMKKPVGKMMSMKGETMEGDTKTAPAPTRTTPQTEPGTRPSHPGRKGKEKPNPKPKAESDSELESKKSEIITAIFNLIDKESK